MPAFTSLYFGLQCLVENMSSEFGGVNDSMIDSIAKEKKQYGYDRGYLSAVYLQEPGFWIETLMLVRFH